MQLHLSEALDEIMGPDASLFHVIIPDVLIGDFGNDLDVDHVLGASDDDDAGGILVDRLFGNPDSVPHHRCRPALHQEAAASSVVEFLCGCSGEEADLSCGARVKVRGWVDVECVIFPTPRIADRMSKNLLFGLKP